MAISALVSSLRAGKVVSVGDRPVLLAEKVLKCVSDDRLIGFAGKVEVREPRLDEFFLLLICLMIEARCTDPLSI